MRIKAGVGDLMRRIGDDHAQVRYSVRRRFVGLHLKTDERMKMV
jgi:hypothetical protein